MSSSAWERHLRGIFQRPSEKEHEEEDLEKQALGDKSKVFEKNQKKEKEVLGDKPKVSEKKIPEEPPGGNAKEPPEDEDKTLKAIEENLKVIERTGITNWQVFRGSPGEYGKCRNSVLCKICNMQLNLEFSGHINEHIKNPKHKNNLMAIRHLEEQQLLMNLRRESIDEKKMEFTACIEDHPKCLSWEWVPLGSFVKVFRMDLENRSQTYREFLFTAETNHEELIFEALEWLAQ